MISYNSAISRWEKEKEQIDNDFIRDIARWENDCTRTKAQHEKKVKDQRISEENRPLS